MTAVAALAFVDEDGDLLDIGSSWLNVELADGRVVDLCLPFGSILIMAGKAMETASAGLTRWE